MCGWPSTTIGPAFAKPTKPRPREQHSLKSSAHSVHIALGIRSNLGKISKQEDVFRYQHTIALSVRYMSRGVGRPAWSLETSHETVCSTQ